MIADGTVADSAGNGNEAATFTSIYDTTAPTQPVLSGTPENSGELKTIGEFHLVADTVETGCGIVCYWIVNGNMIYIEDRNYLTWKDLELKGITLNKGENQVFVQVDDKLYNEAKNSNTITFTFLDESVVSDVEFGGGVSVAVDADTGTTNTIGFTSVQFGTGAKCTFKLSGFESETTNITDLQMWFVVADAPNGEKRNVKVDETATFNRETQEITVTLPAESVENRSSLFIFGVDNDGDAN